MFSCAGQWLFLKAALVPVYEFAPTPYDASLKYVPTALPMEMELGVVVFGPLSVLIVFASLVGAAALALRAVGRFPATL